MSRAAWRSLKSIVCAAGCIWVSGCAGYHVGPVLKADYKSVAVPMFKDKTLHPQLEAQITNAIIKRLQTDGTLLVESNPRADVILTGEITDYRRTSLRSETQDTGTPSEYRITITAKIEARDRRTGKMVFGPTELSGHGDVFIGSDLQSADFQVLPLVADDLARQVVSLLVESW